MCIRDSLIGYEPQVGFHSGAPYVRTYGRTYECPMGRVHPLMYVAISGSSSAASFLRVCAMADIPGCIVKEEEHATLMNATSPPHKHGYEPQCFAQRATRGSVKQATATRGSVNDFAVPKWWPLHSDGRLVTHLYRLIDTEFGTDIAPPTFPTERNAEAISHKLKPEKRVDFSDPVVNEFALYHVDKCSEGKLWMRPFVSASLDLDTVHKFASSRAEYLKRRGQDLSLIHI